MPVRPSAKEAMALFDLGVTHADVVFPDNKPGIAKVQEQFVRAQGYDPQDIYSAEVFRPQERNFPDHYQRNSL